MSDGKIEENGEQKQLGKIKEIVERIETSVSKIEGGIDDKMKRERRIQVSLMVMVFVVSTLLVFLSVTLTSGAGERVYGERWSGYIFTAFAVAGTGSVTFVVYKLWTMDQKPDASTKGKQPKPKPR